MAAANYAPFRMFRSENFRPHPTGEIDSPRGTPSPPDAPGRTRGPLANGVGELSPYSLPGSIPAPLPSHSRVARTPPPRPADSWNPPAGAGLTPSGRRVSQRRNLSGLKGGSLTGSSQDWTPPPRRETHSAGLRPASSCNPLAAMSRRICAPGKVTSSAAS